MLPALELSELTSIVPELITLPFSPASIFMSLLLEEAIPSDISNFNTAST